MNRRVSDIREFIDALQHFVFSREDEAALNAVLADMARLVRRLERLDRQTPPDKK